MAANCLFLYSFWILTLHYINRWEIISSILQIVYFIHFFACCIQTFHFAGIPFALLFWESSRNYFLYQILEVYSSVLSVLCRCLVHLELTLDRVNCWSYVSIFCSKYPVFLAPFIDNSDLSSIYVLTPLTKIDWLWCLGLFTESLFCSIGLSIFTMLF